MHIKVASVCWQGRKVDALKSTWKIMKLIEKPSKFIWKHRQDRIVAQFPFITIMMLDLSLIKGIKSPVVVPAANHYVHNMTSHL
jgi:hypothetical protein